MSLQKANAALVSLLEPFFTRRREFYGDGARLLSAVLTTHREGGGDLRWGWLADSLFLHGQAAAAGNALTGVNISSADYFATANGGPYAALDGATEYFDGGDRTWAEVGAEEFLVWQWVNTGTVAAGPAGIVSKYGGAGHRAWLLRRNAAAFQAYVSGDGTATVNVTSTHGVAVDTFYFTAFYFQPSTLLRIYVGAATDSALIIDSNVVGIPAAIFAGGTASFLMGVGGGGYWNGYLGPGFGRCNVPAAKVDGYVTRLFHLGRWFYEA